MLAGELELHVDLIAEVAARLDLRDPNREAVETLDAEVSQFFDVDAKSPPFEAVIDSATGVGKTYILTGAMELFVAAHGVRDFVVVTPGRTILDKTRHNFTVGDPKSLLGPMSFRPVVITAENFATPAMRTAIDDASQVKLYLFTVQSLLRPDTKAGRKTHKFQEGLGTEFYAHLQGVAQLVVFADEHHAYYGPAFSQAVRDLHPWVLVGLTATPDKKTPLEQIIYRYPLAAAVADHLVKTPVIVGRKDDRVDSLTKLTDGVTLLDAKTQAVEAYCAATGATRVNPVMLVVAKNIGDADEYGAILKGSDFFGGRYAEAVLVVHSDSPDKALEALGRVEESDSPVRIIISVGMLKEGWDVRNVYVVASMRASVSEILTEQTLGRGMRLPWGRYTDIEILDTLEVIAHERYEDLLKKAGVLNESFIDFRTRAAVRRNAQGQLVVVREQSETKLETVVGETQPGGDPGGVLVTGGTPVVVGIAERTAATGGAALRLKQEIQRVKSAPIIVVPVLRMSTVESTFSLADITDSDAFRKLGAALGADPEGELNRTVLGARVVVGADGMKRTQLVTTSAADRIHSTLPLLPADQLREDLSDMVLGSPSVPARKGQRAALAPLLDAFLKGLGDKSQEVLSANLSRAGARLIQLVEHEQRRFMAKPRYDEVVELREFNPRRTTDKVSSADRLGAFSRSLAYEGWTRALFPMDWFDSAPERTVANLLDGAEGVTCWARLHTGELPILWSGAGQQYNPDFIVVEVNGDHWVVEVKMDKELSSADVQGKREAAQRWANHVSADDRVNARWRYLLVSESDVSTSKGSWAALKKLGGE